jgi:hypothetical protein
MATCSRLIALDTETYDYNRTSDLATLGERCFEVVHKEF